MLKLIQAQTDDRWVRAQKKLRARWGTEFYETFCKTLRQKSYDQEQNQLRLEVASVYLLVQLRPRWADIESICKTVYGERVAVCLTVHVPEAVEQRPAERKMRPLPPKKAVVVVAPPSPRPAPKTPAPKINWGEKWQKVLKLTHEVTDGRLLQCLPVLEFDQVNNGVCYVTITDLPPEVNLADQATRHAVSRILLNYVRVVDPEISTVKMVLKASQKSIDNREKFNLIVEMVAYHFGMTTDVLTSPGSPRHVVRPRHTAMYFVRKYTSLTLEEIGRRLGGKDLSAVTYGIKMVTDPENLPEFKKSLEELDKQIQGKIG